MKTVEARCWRCGGLKDGADCARCGPLEAAPSRRLGPTLGLTKGTAGPFRGFGYVTSRPRLWAWIILPLIFNTAIFVMVMIWAVSNLGAWLPDLEQAWPAWIDWARVGTGWLLATLLWIIGVLAALVSTLLLASIVNAPFYDRLSEVVEATYLKSTDPGRPWSALPGDILRSLAASLSLALRQAVVMTLLFALSFTAVGAPLFAVAGFYYAGLAQVDVTLSRKLYPASRRIRWGWRHVGLMIGLGLPLSLLPLLAPFGVVGATLAFLDEPDKA